MCGLAGFIPSAELNDLDLLNISSSMANALTHRGPDAFGSWIHDKKRLALSFRRLAIQDLSSSGDQPMHSSSNRYVVVYNGEIYNHLKLRKKLDLSFKSHRGWIGSSDTETLLAGFECWGIEDTINSLCGMFAMAIFDKKSNKLILARDRMGEKPLYYGIVNNSFVFASELKAIKKFPKFNNPIKKSSIAKFLQYNFIPAPLSIYENIFKLNPGSTIEIDILQNSFQSSEQKAFWQIGDSKNNSEILHNNQETLNYVEHKLQKVVNQQMISDVPLGAFLSGGIDSSLIVALMQSGSMQSIKTFTVGFEEDNFDESKHAKLVARHLNTDHTEVILDSQTAQNVIFDLPDIYDEPFADSSQIPTFLISQIAKQDVTVALSGDGGDEIFGGYNRYIWGPRVWHNVEKIPMRLRPIFSTILDLIPHASIPLLQRLINFTQSTAGGVESLENKLIKLSRLLNSTSQKNLYNNLISHWSNAGLLVRGLNYNNSMFTDRIYDSFPENYSFSNDFVSSMMLVDSQHYLPGDVLCKLDRASMANSLETRVPFLDHELIELANRIPLSLKVQDGEGKIALRKILYKYVPKNLIERPKTGFSIPIAEWLRGPLKEWADELLSETRINSDGYLNAEPIQAIWHQHLSGRYDWSDRLWGILMFQSWLEKN
ncbi:asparagine synthase (glutamine-hydrolyzing) [Gammaproteobacteria bacterium]|nr:asparagine synthase (glutamine-hydrolyzing) [Gammaproteobacteria bacterium]